MNENFHSGDNKKTELSLSFVDMHSKIELYAERQAIEEFEKEMEDERKKSAWNLGKYVNRFIKRNGRTAIIQEKKNRIIEEIRENKYLEQQITSDSAETHTEIRNEAEYFHERTREELVLDENEIQEISSSEITSKIVNLLQDVLTGAVALDSSDFNTRQDEILQNINESLNLNTSDLSTDLKEQFRQWISLYSNLSKVEIENLSLKLKLGLFKNMDINTKEKDGTVINKWIKKVINFTQNHRPLGHIINPTTLALGAATLLSGGKILPNLVMPVVGGIATGSLFAGARAATEADHSRIAILRRQALNYDSASEKRPIEEKFEKANYQIEKAEVLLNNLKSANDPESVKAVIIEILSREELGQENQIDLISYSSGASIQKELSELIKLIKEKANDHLGVTSVSAIKQLVTEDKDKRKSELLEMIKNKDAVYTREKVKKILIDTSIFAGMGGAVSGVGRLLSEIGVFGSIGESVKQVWGQMKEALKYKTTDNLTIRLPENFPYNDKNYTEVLEGSFIKNQTASEIIDIDKTKLPADWNVETEVIKEEVIEKSIPGPNNPTEISGHKRIEGVRDFWYDNGTPSVIDENELRLTWTKGAGNNIVVDVSGMIGKTASSYADNLDIDSEAFASGKIKLLITPFSGEANNPIVFDLDSNGKVLIDLNDEVNKQLYSIDEQGKIKFNGSFAEIAEVKEVSGKNLIRPIATVVGNNSLEGIKVPDILDKTIIPEQKVISVIPGDLSTPTDPLWFPPISGNRYENLGFKPSSELTPDQIKELNKKKQAEEKKNVEEQVEKLNTNDEEQKKIAKEKIMEILQGEFPFEVSKNLKEADVKYSAESAKKAIKLKHENSDFIDAIMDQAKKELELTKEVNSVNLDEKIKEIHDKLLNLWEKVLEKQKILIKEVSQYQEKDLYYLQLLVEIKSLKLLLALLELEKKALIKWAVLKKEEYLKSVDPAKMSEFEEIIADIESLTEDIKKTDDKFSDSLFGVIDQVGKKNELNKQLDDLKNKKKDKDPNKEFQHYLEDTSFELNAGKIIFFEQNKTYNSLNPFKYSVSIDDNESGGKKQIDKEVIIPENVAIYPWISPNDQKMKINFLIKIDNYADDVLVKDFQGVLMNLDALNELVGPDGKNINTILSELSLEAKKSKSEKDKTDNSKVELMKESFGSKLSKEEIYQYFKDSVFDYWENLIKQKKYQEISELISKMEQKDQAKLSKFFGIEAAEIIEDLKNQDKKENLANTLLAKIIQVKDLIENITTSGEKEHDEAGKIIGEMAHKIMQVKLESKPGNFGQIIKFDGGEVEHNEMQIFRGLQAGKELTLAQFHLNESISKAVSSHLLSSGVGVENYNFTYYAKNGVKNISIPHKMYELTLHSANKDQFKVLVSIDDQNRALRGIIKIEIPDGASEKDVNAIMLKIFQLMNLGNILHSVKPEDEKKYLAELKGVKYNNDEITSKSVKPIIVNPEHITFEEGKGIVQELENLGLKAIYHHFDSNHFATIIDSGHLLSTHERWSHGLIETGMSSQQDIKTGGAKSVFTRVLTKNAFESKTIYNDSKPMVILDNSLFARMDMYSYPADKYGDIDKYIFEHRLSPKKLIKALNTDYKSANEQMFNDSVSLKDFCKYIVCADQLEKAKFINIMKSRGYKTFGSENKSIEEVVITKEQFWNLK